MWTSVGKDSYCCPTRQWGGEVGPGRDMRELNAANGHQREEVSRVKAVNTLGKQRKVLSTGRASGKNSEKRRARFGAGEEGSEVASLVCKSQGSPGEAIWLQATHVAEKLLSVDHRINNILLITLKELNYLS